MSNNRDDYDSPWKDILETHFQAFMEFCCPEAALEIDWSKDVISLDKDLIKLMPSSQVGSRAIDKLLKVTLLSGEEVFVYVHVEVQGRKQEHFPKRMFVYHYRLFDKFEQAIFSLAVLTDNNKTWRPTQYKHEQWGCSLELNFKTKPGHWKEEEVKIYETK